MVGLAALGGPSAGCCSLYHVHRSCDGGSAKARPHSRAPLQAGISCRRSAALRFCGWLVRDNGMQSLRLGLPLFLCISRTPRIRQPDSMRLSSLLVHPSWIFFFDPVLAGVIILIVFAYCYHTPPSPNLAHFQTLMEQALEGDDDYFAPLSTMSVETPCARTRPSLSITRASAVMIWRPCEITRPSARTRPVRGKMGREKLPFVSTVV